MNFLRLASASFSAVIITISAVNIANAKPEIEKTSSSTNSFTQTKQSSQNSLTAMVDKEARANGVPVALARAVVRIESNWKSHLTGRAGEVGLMQIKHQTARGVGYRGSRTALYEPATNIKYGMRYLAGAYRLAAGDTCGTVMRYQGGHGAKRMSSAARTYCSKARTIMAAN